MSKLGRRRLRKLRRSGRSLRLRRKYRKYGKHRRRIRASRRRRDHREVVDAAPPAPESLSPDILDQLRAPVHTIEQGINLIGFSRSEIGLGESCRLAARAIEMAGLPFGILPILPSHLPNNDISWSHKEISEPVYRTNLIHLNAPEMPYVTSVYGPEAQRDRYNIGYWHWEVPSMPDSHLIGLDYVDEIWVPTRFVRDAIAPRAQVPVVVIPHGVYVEDIPEHLNREWFGLPKHRFIFLTMYDSHSVQGRKNPMAVIEAFRKLVLQYQVKAELVVKVNNPSPEEVATLRELLREVKYYTIIDRVLGRVEVKALMRSVDCYVSLHRSEGFGLPLAEAMYMGKPVIGTNWSGNIDFMNANNSGVVNYNLVPVGPDQGPYPADQLWANPDVEHAASLMRAMVLDTAWRNQISRMGQETIRAQFSPQVVGNQIKERLLTRFAELRGEAR